MKVLKMYDVNSYNLVDMIKSFYTFKSQACVSANGKWIGAYMSSQSPDF